MKVAPSSSKKTLEKSIKHIDKFLSDNNYTLKPRVRIKPCNRFIKYMVSKSLKYLVIDVVLTSTERPNAKPTK